MVKKILPNKLSEIPPLKRLAEAEPPFTPEEPIIPEENQDIIAAEKPFENPPPFEIPEPGEGS